MHSCLGQRSTKVGVYFFCVDSHLVECVRFNLVSVYKLCYKCSLLPCMFCMFLVVIIKSSLSRSARGVAGHSDRVNHVKYLCYFTSYFT